MEKRPPAFRIPSEMSGVTRRGPPDAGNPPQEQQEPPRRKSRKALETCCDCSRHSTCYNKTGRKGMPGCECRRAGRTCTSCACFKQCRNKHRQEAQPGAIAMPRERAQTTVRSFFVPAGTTATATTTAAEGNNVSENTGQRNNDSTETASPEANSLPS